MGYYILWIVARRFFLVIFLDRMGWPSVDLIPPNNEGNVVTDKDGADVQIDMNKWKAYRYRSYQPKPKRRP